MSYINLALSDKYARAAQIIADIGTGAHLNFYTGSLPTSPDYPASGTLLASLPMSSPAGIASYTVQSVTLGNAGTNGLDGAQVVTGTSGTGLPFQASVAVSGGSMISVTQLVAPGSYSVAPTIVGEPVSGAGLIGASLNLLLTAQIILNPITQTNAIASGTAGYARIVAANGKGIVDLDCGVSGASVIMNTAQITLGSPVACNTEVIVEA